MMQVFNNVSDIDLPSVDNGQLCIYVIEDYPQRNVKIGRTRNPKQRLASLSGRIMAETKYQDV